MNYFINTAHALVKLPPVIDNFKAGDPLLSLICGFVFSWLFTAALLVSVFCALWAAYQYLSSAGDPAKVTKGGKILIYAAVGLAVAIMARTLPVLVGTFLGQNASFTDPCMNVPLSSN